MEYALRIEIRESLALKRILRELDDMRIDTSQFAECQGLTAITETLRVILDNAERIV